MTMALDSGEGHSLQEEGQQPMGGMVETPLGRAPGAREAVGPHPGWELMWTGGRRLLLMGPGLPGDHCRHPAGTSAAVGDKCSALKAGCQDPKERQAGSSMLTVFLR